NDGGDPIFVMDQVSDDSDSDEKWDDHLSIKEGMYRLKGREKSILNKRFFQGKTQMEVADEIGISQAQVSRLEKADISQMNTEMFEEKWGTCSISFFCFKLCLHHIHRVRGGDFIMITWTELQMKDVVMVHNGKRLGQMMDLDIDDNSGQIQYIIVLERNGKGAGLFQKPEEIKINWQQIVTIGADIVLINDENKEKPSIEQKSQQNE